MPSTSKRVATIKKLPAETGAHYSGRDHRGNRGCGTRNSSRKTSLGWSGGSVATIGDFFAIVRPSAVVDDFNLLGPASGPAETDTPLIIDPN
jgi:hypothetical protein